MMEKQGFTIYKEKIWYACFPSSSSGQGNVSQRCKIAFSLYLFVYAWCFHDRTKKKKGIEIMLLLFLPRINLTVLHSRFDDFF